MVYGEKINLIIAAERAILAKRELEKALGVLKDENVSYPPDSVSPPLQGATTHYPDSKTGEF